MPLCSFLSLVLRAIFALSLIQIFFFLLFFHFSIQSPTCSNFQGSTDWDSIDNQALVFSKKNNLDPLCKNYPRRRLLFENVIMGLHFSEMLHFIYTLYKSLTQDNTLLIFGFSSTWFKDNEIMNSHGDSSGLVLSPLHT